ncbi:hypothetical protein B0H16DRAFT_1607528 [Mycena metata]|uniref:Uncharacterized protein n=1 Tax=Mycena metata TaxID=1033252 RepID=A0AAD7MII5_9AGAR|nr:hypothetical protein B0H16DRAFT_1607528 [Mycena metata]
MVLHAALAVLLVAVQGPDSPRGLPAAKPGVCEWAGAIIARRRDARFLQTIQTRSLARSIQDPISLVSLLREV